MWHLVRAAPARLPTGHPVGWGYGALSLNARELDGDIGVDSGMHDKVIGRDDEVPVDGDHIMNEEGAGTPRNGDVATDRAAGASAGSPGEGGDNTVPHACASVSGDDGNGIRERYLVSWFVWPGSAVLPGANDVSSERDPTSGGGKPGASATENGDVQLMYVRRYLREAGEGVIPKPLYEGYDDQLLGYLRGRLDQ